MAALMSKHSAKVGENRAGLGSGGSSEFLPQGQQLDHPPLKLREQETE